MKPRSTVRALLAVTESLLAARTKPAVKAQTSRFTLRAPKVMARLFGKSRPLLLPIKPQAAS